MEHQHSGDKDSGRIMMSYTMWTCLKHIGTHVHTHHTPHTHSGGKGRGRGKGRKDGGREGDCNITQ